MNKPVLTAAVTLAAAAGVTAAFCLAFHKIITSGWRKRMSEPEARAREFLMRHLTEAQRVELIATGYITVIGGQTKYPYVINWWGTYVARRNPHHRDFCWHIHPDYMRAGIHFPSSDHVLTKKLMIEHSEREFLQIAN